jgi:hypothetical protein
MCLATQFEDRWMRKHLSSNKCILLTKSGNGVVINSAEVISVDRKEIKSISIWSRSDSFIITDQTKEIFFVRIKTDKKILTLKYSPTGYKEEISRPEIKIFGCEYREILEIYENRNGALEYIVHHQKRGYTVTPENIHLFKIESGIAYPSSECQKETNWQIGDKNLEYFENTEAVFQKYPNLKNSNVWKTKYFEYEGNDHRNMLWKN